MARGGKAPRFVTIRISVSIRMGRVFVTIRTVALDDALKYVFFFGATVTMIV